MSVARVRIQGTREDRSGPGDSDVLSLTNTIEHLVPSVTHDETHSKQVIDRAEAAGWEVALYSSTVLDGLSPGQLVSLNADDRTLYWTGP